MSNILTLTFKEIRDGYRNKWVGATIVIMTVLALVLTFLGSAPVGTTSISSLTVTVVSLSSLSVFFIPLIALLLSYDSIVGEDERGTLMLLLAYPVSRTSIALGKYFGQLAILSLAIFVGYGAAIITVILGGTSPMSELEWGIFYKLLGSSIMLGSAFIGLGLFLSVLVKDRGTAAAWAIGIWLFFVVLFDMALLGLLSSSAAHFLGNDLVKWVMMANPAGAYRMLNLATSEDTKLLSGMAGLRSDQIVSPLILLVILFAWMVMPVVMTCAAFQRRVS